MTGKYARPERRPVVISGASSGIGASTAIVLATQGFPVALGARRTDKLDELAAKIRADGGEAVAHPLDVSSDESVAAFADAVTADLGNIEALVSNAGSLKPGRIDESDAADFTRELEVNVVGAQRLVHAFAPDMRERKRGDLVFVSSDVAVRARPFMTAYAAGKWGLEGMVHALQMELEGSGIRASLVRPGPVWSEMGMDWSAEDTSMVIEAWIRFGLARHQHFMQPTAIADAIATVLNTPRGVHLSLVQVDPEAPVED